MVNFNLHIFVMRLLSFASAVVGKILIPWSTQGTYKNPERTGKEASGFLVRSHYRSPTPLAEQENCELQPTRLLDQVNSPIWTQRKFSSGAFLSLFFAGFFSLSLNMNQSIT